MQEVNSTDHEMKRTKPNNRQMAIALKNMVKKPSGRQVFEAYTKMVEYTGLDYPEVEKEMLTALKNSKSNYRVNFLEKVTSDNIWKKFSRLFEL